MARNFIPDICKMLGVEVGEEFIVKWKKNNVEKLCKLSETEELYLASDGKWTSGSGMYIWDIIRGDAEFVRTPWRPKNGERYYTFEFSQACCWIVAQFVWINRPEQIALFDKGWVFRTKKEAKKALPKIAEENGVEYEV